MVDRLFEGTEKKLEVAVVGTHASLRQLSRSTWERIVESARAEILSMQSTESFDAYLLSESSLFVFDHRITMITCGRTQLVDAAMAMIDLVGADSVELLVYERKNENFPERQATAFHDDARALAAVVAGSAYRFGAEHAHRIEMFVSASGHRPDPDDTTLEVLMHGLAVERAAVFAGGADSRAAVAGLGRLLSGTCIDDHAFEPGGYSLNGLAGTDYYTVHVTPESQASYASFETSCDFRDDPGELVAGVVEAFAPESFDVLAFVPCPAAPVAIEIEGYVQRKRVVAEVAGYQITFVSFFAPRGTERPVVIELGQTETH